MIFKVVIINSCHGFLPKEIEDQLHSLDGSSNIGTIFASHYNLPYSLINHEEVLKRAREKNLRTSKAYSDLYQFIIQQIQK